MVDQCSRSMTEETEIFKFLFLSGINDSFVFILNKNSLTVNAIPQGGPHVGVSHTGKLDENGFHWEYRCGGNTVRTMERQVRGGARDHGNSGEESISLTSDGTVADRRGEGHHFSVGGVKQARDISS